MCSIAGMHNRKNHTWDWHAPTKDTTSYVRVKDSLASGAGGERDCAPSDLALMDSISDEAFLVLPSPYGGLSTNIQWTRVERAMQDSIFIIEYVTKDGHWETLIKLTRISWSS